MKSGRFSETAFETSLANEGLYNRNFTIKENIASTLKEASFDNDNKGLDLNSHPFDVIHYKNSFGRVKCVKNSEIENKIE